MRVLVTGASGYVGSRLVPALLGAGHEVRAAFSRPEKAEGYWWAPRVEVVGMDVTEPEQVRAAVEGVQAVYYLIHGMGGSDFRDKDRRSAQTMARACSEAGVERIVYLSGVVPDVPESELSEHITSRLEVERALTESGATVITLRAAIVLGSGSTSFEIVRQISERMPVQTVPDWMDSRVQPIAVTDVVAALVGALGVDSGSRSYDVGGPEQLGYPQLLRTYAEVAGIGRPQLAVPGLPSELVGVLAGLLADVPAPTVEALVESLHHDMVCQELDFVADLLPEDHDLVPVEEAIRRALAEPEPGTPPERVDPLATMPHDPQWAGGSGGGLGSLVQGVSAVAAGVVERVRRFPDRE